MAYNSNCQKWRSSQGHSKSHSL